MTNLFGYLTSLAVEDYDCLPGDPSASLGLPGASDAGENCDFRDIPMIASPTVYDREERGIIVEEDDLVVSPQPPGEILVNVLDQEVNVITWGDSVLDSAKTIAIPKPSGATAGWASLGVQRDPTKIQAVCDFTSQGGLDADSLVVSCSSTSSAVPLVGFVAWQRNFADLPAANYGRIVEHSRSSSSP